MKRYITFAKMGLDGKEYFGTSQDYYINDRLNNQTVINEVLERCKKQYEAHNRDSRYCPQLFTSFVICAGEMFKGSQVSAVISLKEYINK